jgi:hypothetical protein
MELKSLRPRSRLSIDSQRSPSGAKTATTTPSAKPSPSEFHGVIPKSDATTTPSTTDAPIPAIRPSTVLLGDHSGARLRFPRRDPTR